MSWRKVDDYAVTNGNQSISKWYIDGCTLYALHEGVEYFIFDNGKAHSEDECEVVVKATYPDADSMKSYLETGGLGNNKNLRDECRALWKTKTQEGA